MNKLFESIDSLFDSGKSLINEDYYDEVINDLGIEPGSDEESKLDSILNDVPTVYDIFTLTQVGGNEYKSDFYRTVEDEDQAYDIISELGAQGVSAYVESRDASDKLIVPNKFLSGLYANDLNESTEGLSKEDKICRLEDKIKACQDRIEEINNSDFFDDGSYEVGLELEDRAMEKADLTYAISEYQKEIDELKGETITEGSKLDLYNIRGEIRDDETGRLMLHVKNKNTGTVGCANFFGNGADMVKVYEGNGDGSDDKEMGFDEFLANYDYALADEDEQPFTVTEASEDESNGSSDIVLLDGKYYYCDDFGWTDVTSRLKGVNEDVDTEQLKSEVMNYLTSKYGEGFELEDTVNGLTDINEIVDSIVDSYEDDEDLSVAEFVDSLIEPHGLIVVKSKGLSEGTSAKRIARYSEFDNGKVLHSWKDMTDEEAEDLAKSKSIEDQNNVYYVCYDNVMNPTSNKVWYQGKSYSFDSVKHEDGRIFCESEESESEIVKEDSRVDDLVTKYIELPYGDFKANNGIGTLNDGTVFWIDSENAVYSVPCSLEELKKSMYGEDQDAWLEFSQSFNRIEDPLETKILVAVGRYDESALDYYETFKDGLPF